MSKLSITTIQSELHWENIDANLEMFSKKLEGLKDQTDLIILPEMFTTGFSMNASGLAEKMDGKSMKWLGEQASTLNAVVTGSIIIEENGQYYNRLIWMRPDQTFETYDKKHLFTLADEHKFYTPGTEKLIVELKGWKVCPLICYDLRFPVWARNVEHYDLLIYVANWPVMRNNAWKSLLTGRAIENLSYTIGVNRCGTDGNELYYSGDTSIVDYEGNLMHRVSNTEGVFTSVLSKENQGDFRKKLNFLADKDQFEIL